MPSDSGNIHEIGRHGDHLQAGPRAHQPDRSGSHARDQCRLSLRLRDQMLRPSTPAEKAMAV